MHPDLEGMQHAEMKMSNCWLWAGPRVPWGWQQCWETLPIDSVFQPALCVLSLLATPASWGYDCSFGIQRALPGLLRGLRTAEAAKGPASELHLCETRRPKFKHGHCSCPYF